MSGRLNTTPYSVWQGVVFLYAGYYRHGVFKFVLDIPEAYPLDGPTVSFHTEMFHPLVQTSNGRLNLAHRFPQWRPHQGMCLVARSLGIHLFPSVTSSHHTHTHTHTTQTIKDYLCHVLHFIKNMFTERVLNGLQPKDCYNVEALNMYACGCRAAP